MTLSSPAFGGFFGLVLLVAWLLPPSARVRRGILLAASLVFAASWGLAVPCLLGAMAAASHACCLRIEGGGSATVRRRWLLAAVAANLLALASWKLLARHPIEFAGPASGATSAFFPGSSLAPAGLVGLSFASLQLLSYAIDVHRRAVAPAARVSDVLLYTLFFPRFLAGPIVRIAEFLPQIEEFPTPSKRDLGAGLARILVGLGKKILLADSLGRTFVDPVFADPSQRGGAMLLLGACAFLLQLHADFSGYTDLAIGTARLLGIRLPENFAAPFAAPSMREFFRRWHRTLSFWFRDYVFLPLERRGSGRLRSAGNVLLTMLLIGLWHGFEVRFVLLWLFFGGLLLWKPFRPGKPATRSRVFFAWLATLGALLLGGIVFRAETLPAAGMYLSRLVSGWGSEGGFPALAGLVGTPAGRGSLLAIALAVAMHLLPARMRTALEQRYLRLPPPLQGVLAAALLGLAGLVSAAQRPFVYQLF